ncbi:hypothetical protein EI94DRAFT_120425 [Lactarius quietus]|nr:hypothetical protein EI94DRAFT_120425 [Lactarius quietus]
MACLLDLPDEVLLFIAIKLALADLGSCLLSCRRLSALISESSLIQYLIRTMLHGLHDPLISDMSIPERVKALDAWAKAWLELSVSKEPFQRHPLSAIGLDQARHCIVQRGVLFCTRFHSSRLAKGYSYLDVLHLLNESKSIGQFSIPNLGGDFHVQSYVYAPESDLMVIIYQTDSLMVRGKSRQESRAQFHQFSTSNMHPSAAQHCLEFDQLYNIRDPCMECCGDNMIVILTAQNAQDAVLRDYVLLVQWKIGRITQLRKARSSYYSHVVAFLSRDILLFALRDTFELELCQLTLPVADATSTLQTISFLKLPSLLRGQEVIDIRLYQPAPLSGTHPVSTRSSHAAFPFRSNSEDDILAFYILFRADHGRQIIFVARRRTLLALALAAESQDSVCTRAWEDWGPRATHWMELDPLNDSLSLAGSRCVLVKYSHLRNHYVLDLRDFNPHRVRALRTALVPTVLSAEACFEEDVVCELPFVSLRKENVGRHVLLDDEWLAEIVWDQDLESQSIHFHSITSPRRNERTKEC